MPSAQRPSNPTVATPARTAAPQLKIARSSAAVLAPKIGDSLLGGRSASGLVVDLAAPPADSGSSLAAQAAAQAATQPLAPLPLKSESTAPNPERREPNPERSVLPLEPSALSLEPSEFVASTAASHGGSPGAVLGALPRQRPPPSSQLTPPPGVSQTCQALGGKKGSETPTERKRIPLQLLQESTTAPLQIAQEHEEAAARLLQENEALRRQVQGFEATAVRAAGAQPPQWLGGGEGLGQGKASMDAGDVARQLQCTEAVPGMDAAPNREGSLQVLSQGAEQQPPPQQQQQQQHATIAAAPPPPPPPTQQQQQQVQLQPPPPPPQQQQQQHATAAAALQREAADAVRCLATIGSNYAAEDPIQTLIPCIQVKVYKMYF